MRPKSVPLIHSQTEDNGEQFIAVELHELLPTVIANIIGDAAYHPRLRALAIAELSSAAPLRTESRQRLATEIADEMRSMGHSKLRFTPEQAQVAILMLQEALESITSTVES